jgi:hypothetical protein
MLVTRGQNDELLGVLDWQGPEDEGLDDAVNRGVESDAESQR